MSDSKPDDPVILARALSKTYRVARKQAGLAASIKALFRREYENVEAVKAVDFSINRGERVGFLGPNGAGKTTTLKMLAGLLTPTSGEARVLGQSPARRPKAFLKSISLVMGQKQQLIWDLPPIDTLDLNRAVYGINDADYRRRLDELVELLEIGDLIEKPARQLSLGERMKCELAAALIHRPEVLFLDEPTIGLDVTMQATVRRFIADYNTRTGATIILTSHYMEDVRALCPRVIVIDHGEIRHDGPLEALVSSTDPQKRIHIRLETPIDADALPATVQIVAHEGTSAILTCPQRDTTEAVRALLDGFSVIDLRVEDPPLEEVMREVFRPVVDEGSPAR